MQKTMLQNMFSLCNSSLRTTQLNIFVYLLFHNFLTTKERENDRITLLKKAALVILI